MDMIVTIPKTSLSLVLLTLPKAVGSLTKRQKTYILIIRDNESFCSNN